MMLTPIVTTVAEKPLRSGPVPTPPWWRTRVVEQLDRRGLTQRALGDAIGFSEFKISRCLTKDSAPYDLIIAISEHLEIPSPFAVAISEPETHTVRTDPTEETIRRNLIEARRERGWDSRRAADEMMLSEAELDAYESGKEAVPNSVLKQKIAPAYGRRVGDFFEEDFPPADPLLLPTVEYRLREGATDEDRAEMQAVADKINARGLQRKKALLGKLKAAQKRRH